VIIALTKWYFRIEGNEFPFLFPTVTICPDPYQNISRITELGLTSNIWNFLQYQSKGSFEGWPIKNASKGENIWETTTFGFWEIIQNISMEKYDPKYVINSSFQLEDNNSWLFAKVRLLCTIFLRASLFKVTNLF
jgi:hypothetical protein